MCNSPITIIRTRISKTEMENLRNASILNFFNSLLTNLRSSTMPDPEFTPVNTTHSDAVEISVIDQKAVDKLIAQIRPELALAVRDLIGDIQ